MPGRSRSPVVSKAMRFTATTVAWLTIIAFAAAGCGTTKVPQSPQGQQGTAPSSATPGVTSGAPVSGAAVPDTLRFTATTIDGKDFDAASLAGKPAVLWFWAAWCPKCRAKAPDVAAVHRDFAGKAAVVGVAGLGSGEAAMDKFASDTGITGLVNLSDDKGEVWRKFGVTTQEYFVVIDSSGAVVHKGPLTGAELRQRVTQLAG